MENKQCKLNPQTCGKMYGLPFTTTPLTLKAALAGYNHLDCSDEKPGTICPVAQALLAPTQRLLELQDERNLEIEKLDMLAATSTFSVQQRFYHRQANVLRHKPVN